MAVVLAARHTGIATDGEITRAGGCGMMGHAIREELGLAYDAVWAYCILICEELQQA